MTANICVLDSVEWVHPMGNKLRFQRCKWRYEDGSDEEGYRFIWFNTKLGRLMAHRGQANLVSPTVMFSLLSEAVKAGWFKIDPASLTEVNNLVLKN